MDKGHSLSRQCAKSCAKLLTHQAPCSVVGYYFSVLACFCFFTDGLVYGLTYVQTPCMCEANDHLSAGTWWANLVMFQNYQTLSGFSKFFFKFCNSLLVNSNLCCVKKYYC